MKFKTSFSIWGTSCFKQKERRFMRFSFSTYAGSASPHHQQLPWKHEDFLLSVLFSQYKTCHYFKLLIHAANHNCLIHIYTTFVTVPKSVGHGVFYFARGYLLVYVIFIPIALQIPLTCHIISFPSCRCFFMTLYKYQLVFPTFFFRKHCPYFLPQVNYNN
jgi:hypothetical protein